jgi:hypothetical protein
MTQHFFSRKDAEELNTLIFLPHLNPQFEMIKSVLTWKDEIPREISENGMDKLWNLFIARSYIHDNRPFSSHFRGGRHLEEAWSKSRNEIPDWPGFKRLSLSNEDRSFYDDERRKARDEED